MVNVFSNSVGAAIVSSLCEKNLLRDIDMNADEEKKAASDCCDAQLLDYEAALGRGKIKNSPIIPLSTSIRSQLQNGQTFANGYAFGVKNFENLPATQLTTTSDSPPPILQLGQKRSENSAEKRAGKDFENRICVEETIVIQF